ncbi:MAG: DNA/RNA non-specific endonuclease [Saprospiraceae bacterium]|nr:DNA/RNA non-specific endonuclease [Saprospiraceae bacterium]
MLLAGVVLALVMIGARWMRLSDTLPPAGQPAADIMLASSTSGNLVHHTYFSLSYVEAHEQPEWVAYTLTREMLNAPRVPRTDWFYDDPAVDTESATYKDYSGSGYTRGHLVPAADMAFDTLAMRESFFMSNVSPQDRAFNQGVWRELEEQTRDWARRFGRLHVITGPVFTGEQAEQIGRNGVTVPGAFYKVLVAPNLPEPRGIGFMIPNALSEAPLMTYAVAIDAVEARTGLDLFVGMDEELEAAINLADWDVDQRRYQRRIEEWNRQ